MSSDSLKPNNSSSNNTSSSELVDDNGMLREEEVDDGIISSVDELDDLLESIIAEKEIKETKKIVEDNVKSPHAEEPLVNLTKNSSLTVKETDGKSFFKKMRSSFGFKGKEEQEWLAQDKMERAISEKLRLASEKERKEKLEKSERIIYEKLQVEDGKIKQKKLEQERLSTEEANKKKLAQVKVEQEFLAKEKAEKERLALERLAKEKAEKERLALERLAKEKADKERLALERLAKEKAEKERLALERLAKEKVEKERLALERLAKEKAEKERLALERLAKEKAEKERLALERLAKEKISLDSSQGEIEVSHGLLEVVDKQEIAIETKLIQNEPIKRSVQLCGKSDDIKNIDLIEEESFNPDDYILSVFMEKLEWAKVSHQLIQLKFSGVTIVIDHNLNTIYCDTLIEKEKYYDICNLPISSSEITAHELSYEETEIHKNLRRDKLEYVHSIESFIWTTSLLISNGRLPENTDVLKKIRLKEGLELDSFETIPHVKEIEKFLRNKQCNLMGVSQHLQIPQRYVFAFYNAALNLGMIEINVKNKRKEKTLPKTSKSKVKPSLGSLFGWKR